jgi:hypothetical protein
MSCIVIFEGKFCHHENCEEFTRIAKNCQVQSSPHFLWWHLHHGVTTAPSVNSQNGSAEEKWRLGCGIGCRSGSKPERFSGGEVEVEVEVETRLSLWELRSQSGSAKNASTIGLEII